jgi:tetratricopeptide (TPR) repeat protein
MSDRIGGSFPDDRQGRPPRPGSGSRPGTRGTSSGASGGTGRPSSYATRPGGADRGRPVRGDDRPRGDRSSDDRRGSAAEPPRIPDSITDDQVSREVRDELGSLSFDRANIVGRYLVAAELATDPEQAYRYAQAAKQLAARVGIVREVSGIMAYKSGRWAEALTELQAGRRLTGRNDYLPLMADAERGLERLDRALDLVHSAEAKRLPRAAQIELRIVESGIRRDQGLADAAVLALQVPELTDGKQRPWSARLFYAYGEALLAAGRAEAAREAFSRAVVADEDEQTDALARLDELDGISVTDLEDDEEDDDLEADDADLDDEADDFDDDEEDEDESEVLNDKSADLDDKDDNDESEVLVDKSAAADVGDDDKSEALVDKSADLDEDDDESDELDPLEEDEDFEDEVEVDDESGDEPAAGEPAVPPAAEK